MTKWTPESVSGLLRDHGWLQEEKEINDGVQYVLTDGTRVNWYRTGKVLVQGKKSSLRTEAEALFSGSAVVTGGAGVVREAREAFGGLPVSPPRRVFIVYGHDVEAREQLELLLRRFRLEPIVLQNIPSAGDTIIEKLETLTAADFACVLITPDDEGRRRIVGNPDEPLRPRARQNVVLELGMVLARLGRRRVAVLLKGGEVERPSDIEGLIYLPFTTHVGEVKNGLAANLQEAGFAIQVKDLLA